MSLLITSVVSVLLVWAICSLAEASLYAVRMPYVRKLEQSNHASGKLLVGFKANMEQPISAILIVNTIVAAAGASIAGAQASRVFGEANLWRFSTIFTIAALLISEIIPKILGVAYNRPLSRLLAKPISVVVFVLYPIVWVIERSSILMKPRVPMAVAPEDEVQQMAEISAEEGSIMPYEANLVRHVLDLDKLTARDIMTPKSAVVRLAESMTLGEVKGRMQEWSFSRIPVHQADDKGFWTGLVLARDILTALAADRFDESLKSLAKPLYFVSEHAGAHKLLKAFLKRQTHMFGVVGRDGKVVGVVTLEDVLEALIGAEIVDELDTIVDMQKLVVAPITKTQNDPSG